MSASDKNDLEVVKKVKKNDRKNKKEVLEVLKEEVKVKKERGKVYIASMNLRGARGVSY